MSAERIAQRRDHAAWFREHETMSAQYWAQYWADEAEHVRGLLRTEQRAHAASVAALTQQLHDTRDALRRAAS